MRIGREFYVQSWNLKKNGLFRENLPGFRASEGHVIGGDGDNGGL